MDTENKTPHSSNDGEEEETPKETSLLIQTTQATEDQMNNGVKQLMNVVSSSSRVVGDHKAFIHAVNAATIQRRKELKSYNKAKNLGG